jgi:hypothetical protein
MECCVLRGVFQTCIAPNLLQSDGHERNAHSPHTPLPRQRPGTMIIRLTMFPIDEAGLLPIYERLLACPKPVAARALRSLLQSLHDDRLPSWFESMPREAFATTRARSIRITINEKHKDPALERLRLELEPLSNQARLFHIKRHLKRLLEPKALGAGTPVVADSATPAPSPWPSNTLLSRPPSAPPSDDPAFKASLIGRLSADALD